jgi:5-methylcytosine-specific restriction endonuclease McrA
LVKRCSSCGNEKPLEEFVRHRDQCKSCRKIVNDKWRAKERERPSIIRCSCCDSEKQSSEFAKDRLQCRQCRANVEAQRRKRCADFVREKDRQRYARDREKRKAAVREYDWARRYPERNQVKGARRRSRERAAENTLTFEQWELLKSLAGHRCLDCGESKPLTVDHVVPIAHGGKTNVWNIQPLCRSCNCSKQDKIEDFRGDDWCSLLSSALDIKLDKEKTFVCPQSVSGMELHTT